VGLSYSIEYLRLSFMATRRIGSNCFAIIMGLDAKKFFMGVG